MLFSKILSTLLFITEALFSTDNLSKFSFKILKAILSCSTNKTFLAPRDTHSKPNEPTPEYKSKTSAFSMSAFINFECFKTLKIFSLTESLSGLVIEFFKKLTDLPFKTPLIIRIFFYYSPTNIFSIKSICPI